jgi:hypothetical protein
MTAATPPTREPASLSGRLRAAIRLAREAGLGEAADELERRAFAFYTTSSECLGEIGEAIDAFLAREQGRIPAPVTQLLDECLTEVARVWPKYGRPLRAAGSVGPSSDLGGEVHCESCGAPAESAPRCPRCGRLLAFVWLLAAGAVVWVLDLVVYGAARVLYSEIAGVMEGVGAETPFLSQLFFQTSDVGAPLLVLAALVLPMRSWLSFKGRPAHWRRSCRFYFLASAMAAVWALLSVGAWYLAARSHAEPLR